LQITAITKILQGGNRRGVADPLDMVIVEGDEYALPGDMLSPYKDRLWTLKQCKKYITRSHIVWLWYCHDMDAIRGGLARWKFRMIACAILEFGLRYGEVIWWTRGGQYMERKIIIHMHRGTLWMTLFMKRTSRT
jgi:hypothetical protein